MARDVVVVEGPDAVSYVHSQVSQDVAAMAVGDARWTFVLDPTGKIVAFAQVRRTGDERLEFDIDGGFGEQLLARLNRFKIRVQADTSLVPGGGGPDEGDTERVARGWPKMGAEIVPGETLVAGTGLANLAVSFTKGCYPGQELVERMDSRGADAPRSLRVVPADAGAAPGDPVVDPESNEVVGEVTSVGGGRALAWIRRGSSVGTAAEH